MAYIWQDSFDYFAVCLSQLPLQVDIKMDTQVADVLSIGTNVVLSSKAPASTYFVVNRVIVKAVANFLVMLCSV